MLYQRRRGAVPRSQIHRLSLQRSPRLELARAMRHSDTVFLFDEEPIARVRTLGTRPRLGVDVLAAADVSANSRPDPFNAAGT